MVKSKAAPGLWLEDVPEPELGINDVLIRVLRTGICGTDVHIYKWDDWAQKTIPVPMVVGHEFVGEIVEVGSNVERLSPRPDRLAARATSSAAAAATAWPAAGICARTRSGVGVNRPGAFAEYIVIPDANVWHHADGIDLDIAAIFDPFGNAVHTALQFDVVGEDVLITGAGPIGIMAAGDRAPCRRAPRRHHRRQRLPPGSGRASSARPAPSTSPARRSPTSRRSSA